MYLKRLELYGFKSFADKTVLEFKPGITLIVGPNGSGKSNIADAIRWVLGEQSPSRLRGTKMEEVIFAGSEKRRSLGMAEVSLTIDNSDGVFPLEYNEVTVTRRLYRSGESEFMINQVPCRLKDIHELFMDTGVGREGFSMIGQGKVDELLMARPEDRRGILEEAAGIVKYRYRKKEASKKLEETANHLVRLNDLVKELEDREEPLAAQAEEAKKYRRIKDELDNLELGIITGEIRQAKNKLTDIQNELSGFEDVLVSDKSGFIAMKTKEQTLRLDLDAKTDLMTSIQKKIYDLKLSLDRKEGDIKTHEKESQSLKNQVVELKADIERFTSEKEILENQRKQRQDQGARVALELDKARAALLEEENIKKNEDNEYLEARRILSEKEESSKELLNKKTEISNTVTSYKEQLLSWDKHLENYEEDVAKCKQDIEEAKSRLVDVENSGLLLVNEVDKAKTKVYEASEDVDRRAGILRNRQEANRAIAATRSDLMARLKVLSEMEKDGQGYATGVKEVLKRKSQDKLPGIVGTVASVISITKEYEQALEIALGNGAQDVITLTERSATDAIRWLKNEDKGRVTFLPLDTLVPNVPNENEGPRGKGVIGRMVDLIDFSDKYLPAMEFLLGRIWLAEDLQSAVAAARACGYKYKLVTVDGQIVNAGGSLTGGSSKATGTGFISRRREIEEMGESIKLSSQKLVEGENLEDELKKDWEEAKSVLNAANEELKQAEVNLAAGERNRLHAEQDVKKAEKALADLSKKSENDDFERVRLEGFFADAQKDLADIEAKIAFCEEELNNLRNKVLSCENNRAARQTRLTELRIELAGNQEKQNSFDSEDRLIYDQIRKLINNVESQKTNIELCLERAKRHEDNAISLGKSLEESRIILKNEEDNLNTVTNERLSILDSLKDIDESTKKINEEIGKKEERLHSLQLAEVKISANLEEWAKILEENYEIEVDKAIESVEPITDKKKAQQRAKEIRDEIASMPNVNLGAVEEYLKLEDRLNLYHEQMEDIIHGKADLESVISEMDQIVVKKFKETFEEINTKFQNVFKELFEGGKASLYMTDPSNLLETGVDIMAQPPGKKAQNLALLSGGEKALTAISLLLAMLETRPSPFSILDEIESALDESNVDRFAGIIKDYSEESGSQFIIISHRRGTMTIGDTLYGVSSEEFSGVSKILSVKLED